jgi:NAD-dependent SIR2 family protein deacetylase
MDLRAGVLQATDRGPTIREFARLRAPVPARPGTPRQGAKRVTDAARRQRGGGNTWQARCVHDDTAIAEAAAALRDARALLVTAGAGMGVDSGLPDFRGNEGFWRAYPPLARLGVSFVEMANPAWFHRDPELAWGFYGHRLELYRRTRPHQGFARLLACGRARPGGCFVFTSNVDGHFQAAGFDPERVVECHGALSHAQCLAGCGTGAIFEARFAVDVDETTFRARRPLPACPRCGGLARPNVLMFGDGDWLSGRTDAQERRFMAWLAGLGGFEGLVVVECGAGTAIPTVRHLGERLAAAGARLIRINVREPEVPPGQIGIAAGAAAALAAILP